MSQFKQDLNYSETQREKLKEFYRVKAYDGRFVFINKNKLLSKWLQENAVDTIMQISDSDEVYIEEKIVRWKGKKYEATTLETMSCTIPGREKDGWMKFSRADILAYGFEQENGDIELYLISFPKLKEWFWRNWRLFPETIN